MNKSYLVSPDIDQNKIQSDIQFVQALISFSKQNNWRLVVYGGYGQDGYLKTITRNHGDIDLVVYGQTTRSQALESIVDYLKKTLSEVEISSKDEDFLIDIKVKSKSLGGNFYYVQTDDDPYENLNTVIKLDGTQVTNSPSDFPPPVPGQLGDLVVEVQNQTAHLADILRKRGSGESLSKHDQDISNIQTLLAKK